MARGRIPRHAVREHLPQWLILAAQDSSRIRIASPYVTSRRLLNRCPQEGIELFTDFNAMSFITGASKLEVLKSVVVQGSKVFHVHDLHAKVILIDDLYFSLGSQNLTTKGCKTVKASFISGSDSRSWVAAPRDGFLGPGAGGNWH